MCCFYPPPTIVPPSLSSVFTSANSLYFLLSAKVLSFFVGSKDEWDDVDRATSLDHLRDFIGVFYCLFEWMDGWFVC